VTRGTKDIVMQVANHHSTLSLFAAVQALLECGAIYDTAADATAHRIIKLCKAERQRQLRKMDAARARVTSGVPPTGGTDGL
jgi:hypothetical protein